MCRTDPYRREGGSVSDERVEVKAWIMLRADGKPETFLQSYNVAETKERAKFIGFAPDKRVVRCTITYDLERLAGEEGTK
jgi:hypothetical protein